MLSLKDIKEIHYFKDIVSIKEIKQGYSGRKKYKIATINESYFIKIHSCKLNKKEMVQGKILYET